MNARLPGPALIGLLALLGPMTLHATPGPIGFGPLGSSESVLGGLAPAAEDPQLTIELLPSSSIPVSTGNDISLTVRFSDLDPAVPEIISAFTLVVLYDNTLVTPQSSSFLSTDKLSDPSFPLPPGQSDSINGPPSDLIAAYDGTGFVFSQLSLASDATLASVQAGQTSFDAIEILFQANADGVAEFSYVYDADPTVGIDIKGANSTPYVVAAAPVPPAWTLLTLGLLALPPLRDRLRRARQTTRRPHSADAPS